MQKIDAVNREINYLKKRIIVIQWDLPNLTNQEIKRQKEKELSQCLKDLDMLIKKSRKNS